MLARRIRSNLAWVLTAALLWPAGTEPGSQPARLDIRPGTGSALEEQGREQLLRILATYDLEKWLFTRAVVIESRVIPHSHPVVTLNTRYLRDDVSQLSTFLHEQLHWFLEDHVSASSTAEAIQELRGLYPRVPAEPPEGARGEESTYLHLIVCYLELQALSELVGEETARGKLAAWEHYTWVYTTVLADTDRIREIVERHIGAVRHKTEERHEEMRR